MVGNLKMPMTLITLSKVPPSLRGDLTKWMQEIDTGVYIGNFNTRIREKLWERVISNIGKGQATISYASQNEQGYQFKTFNTERENIDFDGISLVMLPSKNVASTPEELGFSNASKFYKAKKYSKNKTNNIHIEKETSKRSDYYIVLDIETTGVNRIEDDIIEIAAVKKSIIDGTESHYSTLITHSKKLPSFIVELTGITNDMLSKNARPLKDVLPELIEFIDDCIIVGYSINFDIGFLNYNLKKLNIPSISNKTIDIMEIVKSQNKFLKSYKLANVLPHYDIKTEVVHRALEDAKIIDELASKVNNFKDMLK